MQVIARDIRPGEVFKASGSVRIDGNVGAAARIVVTEGGLEITGDVGNGATLQVDDRGAKPDNTIKGLRVRGQIGHQVRLQSFSDIRLHGVTGDGMRATARADFHAAAAIGHKAFISAHENIHVVKTGDHTRVSARRRAHLRYIGAHTDIRAGEIFGTAAARLPFREPAPLHDIHIGRRTTRLVTGTKPARVIIFR